MTIRQQTIKILSKPRKKRVVTKFWREDLSNRKFGKLNVLSYAFNIKNKSFWNCLCDCGSLIVADGMNVKHGGKKSCGCLRKTNPSSYKYEFNYFPVHKTMKKMMPKSQYCEHCKLKKNTELANVSGKYLEKVEDWEWLCRRCHILSDGRLLNLKQYAKK